MKKSLEEIKNVINKVIDKKRLDNMIDDANSLKKNLDFFLKGFESSVDNSWRWIYVYNPEMIHNEHVRGSTVLYRSGDKGDLRLNELLHEGDIDVPSEWELFFEEEEKNKEYQDYLNLKSKFEKDELKQPTKEKEENQKSSEYPVVETVEGFILSAVVISSVLLIIGVLYALNK